MLKIEGKLYLYSLGFTSIIKFHVGNSVVKSTS